MNKNKVIVIVGAIAGGVIILPIVAIIVIIAAFGVKTEIEKIRGIREAKVEFVTIQNKLQETYTRSGVFPPSIEDLKLSSDQTTSLQSGQFYRYDPVPSKDAIESYGKPSQSRCSYKLSLYHESYFGEGGGDIVEYYQVSTNNCK